ncbi:MAG TPA: metal ABC transporter substrate-binding protein [Acidimicrobiales bacterium]|nr:metal ABC transporter substrate-binding protein [Acidimicrobiales bacterium]
MRRLTVRSVRRYVSAAGGAAVAAAALATGCSPSALPKAVSTAPVLAVVTGLWPLAQMAAGIGGTRVAVADPVPAGSDPFTFQPGAAATGRLHAAGLVIIVGGLQPRLDAAARGAPRVLDAGAAVPGADRYVWLDPATMLGVVTVIARAMEAADPPAAPLFRRNTEGLLAEIRSLGFDYSSTLATCPGRDIVTADDAFESMAADYGLTDHVVGPTADPATTAALASALRARSAVGVLEERWIPGGAVRAVATALGRRVHQVETLAAPPVGGTAQEDTYPARMEQLLGQLSGALGCATGQ